MKKIGIVGGIAWPSTVEYYSELCRLGELWNHSHPHAGHAMPEMVIESLDHDKAVAYLGTDDDEASWSRFDQYHRAALQRLEVSSACVALIASNTSHHRFAEIVRGIGIPVINMFEVAARECARIEAKQVLILGTATIMRSARLREIFAAQGIEATGPEDPDARAMTIRLSEQLQHGKTGGTDVRLGDIARRCCEQQFAAPPVVCLACTELPLAFPELKTLAMFEIDGVTYINTTAAHIDAVFDFAST